MRTTLLLLLGLAAHIACGIGDVVIMYNGKKRIDFKCLSDNEKMSAEFEGMSPSMPLASILLGVYAIAAFTFSYLELARYISGFSRTAAVIMYIGIIIYGVTIAVHHVLFGVIEWFYIRLGRTEDARQAVMEFMKKTSSTMIVGYLSSALFLIPFFIMVVGGNTGLPRWACVFNALPALLLLLPAKLPAKANIAGAFMFLGLLFVM